MYIYIYLINVYLMIFIFIVLTKFQNVLMSYILKNVYAPFTMTSVINIVEFLHFPTIKKKKFVKAELRAELVH